MKCSQCSAPISPVTATDIDGTLGDYHAHFIRFASMWTGVEIVPEGFSEPYDGSESFSDWCSVLFDIDLATFRSIKLAYRQGGMKRSMPVYPFADAYIGACRELSETWLTTTRPHDRFDRIDPDTREWLARSRMGFDGLLFGETKMDELAARVDPDRVAFVLDDQVENLVRAAALFPEAGVFLLATAWNRGGPSWPFTVGSLLDARAVMTAHVQDWGVRHAFDDLPTTPRSDT